MMRYMLLRSKQLIRLLPRILLAAVVLALTVAVLGGLVIQHWENGEDHQKFRVALCGTQEDPLIQVGILALESLDQTRFSVEILTMEEEEALQELESGRIEAYVRIPEGFQKRALSGDVPILTYVTAAGSTGVEAVFQQEVTRVIEKILLTAQKGSYGGYYAVYDNGYPEKALEVLNGLCIEYVELALVRGNGARVDILGVGDGLDLKEYLVCGLTVVLLCLLCLPFAPMLIQRDVAINRLLMTGGVSASAQSLGEYGVFFSGLLALALIIGVPLQHLCGVKLGVWQWIPVVMMVSAVSFFAFSLTKEWISGLLLQFLAVCGMCFLSGCMYPDYFFPDAIQKAGQWLPTGLCRGYFADCILGRSSWETLLAICLLWLVLVGVAMWIRSNRTLRTKEAA